MSKDCYDGHISYFAPIGHSLGKPDCAYLKGFPCGVFSFKDRESVCCFYDNVSMSRCSMLPSSVKNGFRSVKYYAGKLHGDF